MGRPNVNYLEKIMENISLDDTYTFIQHLQEMMSSNEEGYGLTNEQLEKLAEKSGIKISDFRHCFSKALNRIAS